MLKRFRRKPEEKPEVKPEVKALTFYDAGKDHDLMDVQSRHQEAFANMDWQDGYNVQRGAIAAFYEGRSENIQTLLAHPDLFKEYHQPQRMLCLVTERFEKVDEKASIIKLAMDKIPEEKRQGFLNKALQNVVQCGKYHDEHPFIAALIEAGADVNAEVYNASGFVMAWAITNGYPQGVIQLLHDEGAKFEDALTRIQTRPWWDEGDRREKAIQKLKVYRKAITGQPDEEEGDLRGELAALRAEITALREEIAPLRSALSRSAPFPAPKKKAASPPVRP